jgi:hypothetical protein
MSYEVTAVIRFLGITIGSAATLGGLLLLLGVPRFHGERQADTRPIEVESKVADTDPASASIVVSSATDDSLEMVGANPYLEVPQSPSRPGGLRRSRVRQTVRSQ